MKKFDKRKNVVNQLKIIELSPTLLLNGVINKKLFTDSKMCVANIRVCRVRRYAVYFCN